MQVAQAISLFFQNKGVEYIFHLPGIHTLPLNHILSHSNIKIIVGRDESNAAFMADGFARATGRPAILLVTPGPGLGNVVTPCMEAYGDDVPLMIVFVDVRRKNVEKGTLHAVKEPEAIFEHISKAVFVVSDASDLPQKLEAAYFTAATGRPGPVVLSIPFDILEKESVPAASFRGVEEKKAFRGDLLVEAVKGAERPVIIGGKGLIDKNLGGLIDEICIASAIPFLLATSGKGVVNPDSPYLLGHIAGRGIERQVLAAADKVIALGTRLRHADTTGRGVKIGSLVHVDVDDQWLGKNFPCDCALSGDMGQAVGVLREALGGRRSSWDMERLLEARKTELTRMEERHEGLRIVNLLRRIIPRDTMTVWDLSMCGYWAECYFPVFEERSFLFPKGIWPIFYAFPAAIGAKLGKEQGPCLCVTGDGSFLPTAGELATVAARGIPLVVLIYNNSSFGVLEGSMNRRYGMEGAMALTNPDFTALARSFGIKAEKAEEPP